jgi:hypothetical protein
VRINGIHPTIISYRYANDGREIESKYKVLEERKFEIGDNLEIKELNGNSIIKDLEPYDFSGGFIFIFLVPCLIVGLSFLIYSILIVKKELKLYQYGRISKGKIVSISTKSGLFISNVIHGLIIHYEYKTREGNELIGESFTSEYSILGDKKNGDYIPIFISTHNEEKSCIVPKLESLRNKWDIDFE